MTTMIHEMMALLRHSDKAQLNQFMARNPKADCAETLVHLLVIRTSSFGHRVK
ncbi:hypothetical protein KW517_20840 [Vibrio fluvialis]|nr:hypothetical protein [Vibrio fluvialis]